MEKKAKLQFFKGPARQIKDANDGSGSCVRIIGSELKKKIYPKSLILFPSCSLPLSPFHAFSSLSPFLYQCNLPAGTTTSCHHCYFASRSLPSHSTTTEPHYFFSSAYPIPSVSLFFPLPLLQVTVHHPLSSSSFLFSSPFHLFLLPSLCSSRLCSTIASTSYRRSNTTTAITGEQNPPNHQPPFSSS